MILRDKVTIFINRAQSKIVDLALLTADDLYEAFSDDTNIKLANELEDLVASLQDPLLDWSNYEIELAIDYYTYKAELADLALVNYTQYGTYISTGSGNSGGSYIDSSWIDPFNSLSTRVNNNHNSTLSEIDRLDNRINTLDFSTIIPQSLLDDVEDNNQARHSHANKSILDSITNGHLESIAYNNDHRQDSTIHVTTTQKTRWDNKVSQAELSTGLSGKSDVGHTHPIPDIEGLDDFLETLTPEKGDKGDPGVSPYIEIGTYEEGEELEISVDNTNPMFPKLNFVVPVAQDGKDFSIDVLGKAASRLKAIYTDEPLGYTYLGTDNGVLYFRRPLADDGVTPISATTSSGWYGVTFMGKDGWSPIIGTQNIDNDTVVLRLMGWIGGTSEMPTFGTDPNQPVYIGSDGFTYDLGQALNIKGRQGPKGDKGKLMFPDASGDLTDKDSYDSESKEFIFLDLTSGEIYIKVSDTEGDWSYPFQWKGDKGDKGDLGNTGESLEFLWDGTSLGIKRDAETSYTFKDLKGEKGEKGDVGKGFFISESFESVAELDGSNLDIDSIVIINPSDSSNPDNGKIYYWDGSSFTYLYKISDGATIKGDKGNTGDKGEKGDKGDIGETGKSLQFIWSGTSLGVKTEDALSYTYVELKGDEGLKGDDGDSLQFEWDGTSLGVKTSSDDEYIYVDLEGTNSGIEEAPEDGELYLRKNGAWEKFNPSANISTYIHEQVSPNSTWNIEHNLGKYPSITIVDSANNMVMANVQYIDSNNVRLSFVNDSIGKAYLN